MMAPLLHSSVLSVLLITYAAPEEVMVDGGSEVARPTVCRVAYTVVN